MITVFHITVALISVGFTTFAFLRPAKSHIDASYVLVAATLISGTYLAFHNPAHLLQTCLSGILYISGVSIGLVFAQRKLAADNTTRD